jgi:hypothetical protein
MASEDDKMSVFSPVEADRSILCQPGVSYRLRVLNNFSGLKGADTTCGILEFSSALVLCRLFCLRNIAILMTEREAEKLPQADTVWAALSGLNTVLFKGALFKSGRDWSPVLRVVASALSRCSRGLDHRRKLRRKTR